MIKPLIWLDKYILYDNNKIYSETYNDVGFPMEFNSFEEAKEWMFNKWEELNGNNRIC